MQQQESRGCQCKHRILQISKSKDVEHSFQQPLKFVCEWNVAGSLANWKHSFFGRIKTFILQSRRSCLCFENKLDAYIQCDLLIHWNGEMRKRKTHFHGYSEKLNKKHFRRIKFHWLLEHNAKILLFFVINPPFFFVGEFASHSDIFASISRKVKSVTLHFYFGRNLLCRNKNSISELEGKQIQVNASEINRGNSE